MSKFIDLSGQKFGRLTVISRAKSNTRDARWLCKCICGNEKIILGYNLKNGITKSCGCLQRELSSKRLKMNNHQRKHGLYGTRIYRTWAHMKERCYNPTANNYCNYGGRGIKVCQCWKNSFQAFYDDVSKLPHFGEKGYSLDRINNDGNYEINNVRWATAKEQANNQRTNHLETYNGKTQTISQWASEFGINSDKLRLRIKRLGWSIEKALNTP